MKNILKIWLLFLITFVVQSKLFAADKVVDSLSRMLKTANADSTKIDIHTQLSNLLLSTDYKQSLMHATSAVRLAEKTDDYARKIKSYKVAGAVCMYMGLNDLSVNYYTKYFRLAESKNDQTEMGAASFNLASVQMALNNYPKARDVILEAWQLLKSAYVGKGQVVPEYITLLFRLNLGLIYQQIGSYKSADSVLVLAMPTVKGVVGQEPQLLKLYHIQAQLYISKGELDNAQVAIYDARKLAIQLGDISGKTATYITGGQVYEKKGDDKAAIKEYTEGYRNAEAIGAISLQAMMAEPLYKLYQKKGISDSSKKYFDRFTMLKTQTKELEAKEKLMRDELLKEFKKMEGELQQKVNTQGRTYFYVTLLALLIAGLGIFGTLRNRKRYRRAELESIKQELEAERLALEKEKLTLEVADKEKKLGELEYKLSKNAMLDSLVSELQTIYIEQRDVAAPTKKGDTAKLVQQGKIWEEFEVRFAKTHGDFYDRLVKAFPDITLNERRLCAFLKLDMTTKEISTITGQSIRAIEIARTRLRKKFNLNQSDISLFEFLSSI